MGSACLLLRVRISRAAGTKGLGGRLVRKVRAQENERRERTRLHRIIIPHLYSLRRFEARLAAKLDAPAMNFALHAIKRGRAALINDATRCALFLRSARRCVSILEGALQPAVASRCVISLSWERQMSIPIPIPMPTPARYRSRLLLNAVQCRRGSK